MEIASRKEWHSKAHHNMDAVVSSVVGDNGGPTQMFAKFRQRPFPLATLPQIWWHLQHKLLETLWADSRAAQTR